MATKRIKGDLSYEGIGKIIDGLKKYRDGLDDKCNQIVEELMNMGVEYAKSICPVDTGEARESIYGFVDGAFQQPFIHTLTSSGIVHIRTKSQRPDFLPAFLPACHASSPVYFLQKL